MTWLDGKSIHCKASMDDNSTILIGCTTIEFSVSENPTCKDLVVAYKKQATRVFS